MYSKEVRNKDTITKLDCYSVSLRKRVICLVEIDNYIGTYYTGSEFCLAYAIYAVERQWAPVL